MPLFGAGENINAVFVELGLLIVGLAVLARLASRWSISTIPLYLLGGLAFGDGGLLPLRFSEEIVHFGAETGVILLLFMLGLEYSGAELRANLGRGLPAGLADLLLNFPPGLLAGWLLGWEPLACVLLGGVTYISSSGIIAKLLGELRWKGNPETPTILSVLVLEDLAMAVYLPLVTVLLIKQGMVTGLISVGVALATVTVILVFALRYGESISRRLAHQSDEVIVLSTFGIVLLVAGTAGLLQVSAGVAAFLVGIALSGPVATHAHRLVEPLRDLFAATFFLFFGLKIDPSTLPPVLLPAVALGILTIFTKGAAGWWAARREGVDRAGRLRAGAALVARGEFSIVIAGLGVSAGLEPALGPFAAAYVLFLAVVGPILTRVVDVALTRKSKDEPAPDEGGGKDGTPATSD